MSARARFVGLLAVGVLCGVLLSLHLWRAQQARQRMDLCLRVQASCMGPSLAQEESLIDLLVKVRRRPADRAKAMALLGGLRDCWRYAGSLCADAPEEGFFRSLHEAESSLALGVQAFDDAVRLNPRTDAGTVSMALVGLRGSLGDQRRYLLSFADACRTLPWTPAQEQALELWAQSLQPRR